MQSRLAQRLCVRSYSTAKSTSTNKPHLPKSPHTPEQQKASQHERTISNKDFLRMQGMTDKMVDRASKPPPGWQRTRKIRGEEKRLTGLLRQAEEKTKPVSPEDAADMSKIADNVVDPAARKYMSGFSKDKSVTASRKRLETSLRVIEERTRPVTLEKAQYHAGEDVFAEDADPSSSTVFTPGTFIETRRNEVSTHGVVLGEMFINRRWRVLMLISSGDVWAPLRDDVMFAVAGFVPSDLVARCGKREVTTNDTELMARVNVLKRLHQVDKAVEEAYNNILRSTRELYSQAKSPDPNTWSKIDLADAAKIISPNPDLVQMFAVHKFLMNQSLQYAADTNYRISRTFHVRPQAHIDNIEVVTDMIRQAKIPTNPVNAFVTKARGIIDRHQEIRQKTRNEAPALVPTKVTWTTEEKQILTFLLHSLRPKRSTQTDPYQAGVIMILKKLHPSLTMIQDSVIHQTLVDLGVFPPWQDVATLSDKLDQTTEQKAALEAQQNAIIEKAFSSPSSRTTTSTPPSPRGPEDFYLQDPLDSVRHDFGDLPVFVIDDVTAEELDDGISVESIPSEPGFHWVHTHIADPASVLPPTHIFSQEAKKMGESTYFIDHSRSMLPRALMDHGLSLGSSMKNGEPQRVLTFSGKIDPDGDIVDYKVRAGLVRNVKVTNYHYVDVALQLPSGNVRYPFSEQVKQTTPIPNDTLAPEELDTLRLCNDVIQRLVARRAKSDTFNVSQATSDIRLRQRLPEAPMSIDKPTVYRGFPDLEYILSSVAEEDVGARQIVAEMMKVASRVASRFGRDHGLPLLRRVSGPAVIPNPSDLPELLKMRTPNGFVPIIEGLKKGVMIASAEYSVEPLGHWGLGIPDGEGYSRVTSPLRRYSDLIAHWQIHSALLSASSPPFSLDWLKNYGNLLVWEDRARKKKEEIHRDFWKLMYIRYQMEGKSKNVRSLLDNLKAQILAPPAPNTMTMYYQSQVHIPDLGIRAILGNLERDEIVAEQVGEMVPIRLEEIRLGSRPQLEVKLMRS